MYQGTSICAYEDVVFVSINYRVGLYGSVINSYNCHFDNYYVKFPTLSLKQTPQFESSRGQ